MSRQSTFEVTVGQALRYLVGDVLRHNKLVIIGSGYTEGSTCWTFTVMSSELTAKQVQRLVWDAGVGSCEVKPV